MSDLFAERQADDMEMSGEHVVDEEEEAREEVAEAVQQQRRERLRDDVLGMVCPSDWTIQAPEPPGIKRTQVDCCMCIAAITPEPFAPGCCKTQ